MQVENTQKQRITAEKPRNITVSDKIDIASELKNQQTFNVKFSQKIDTLATTQAAYPKSPEPNKIKLGTLSGDNKTVAQLLLANPELKAKTWSIIHNPINQNKAFHQISAGKEIFYNPKTQELHWSKLSSSENNSHENNTPGFDSVARAVFSASSLPDTTLSPASGSAQKIMLGQINQENPTISNLLSQQSDFKAQRWDIIHSKINQNKAFTKIPGGTMIYIDSKTKELSWNKPLPGKDLKTVSSITDNKVISNKVISNKVVTSSSVINSTDNNAILARKLDDAVKPFMGTEYKHLDCYTLVVNGLENMGIQYRGKGSLSRQLLQRAQVDGRADNAYFTGEGITEALGDKVYTRAITHVNNIAQQSKDIFQEMKNLMKKGDILSFSLQTKGHTGVISQNKEQWTYINSGRLDNSISTNAPRHGVGEETLLNEINNWVKLAQQRKESLQITVGRLDKQKFA